MSTLLRSSDKPSAEMIGSKKGHFAPSKDTLLQLDSEILGVQASQDLLQDVIMGLVWWYKDEDIVHVYRYG